MIVNTHAQQQTAQQAAGQQTYNWPLYELTAVWNDPDPILEFLAGSTGIKPGVSLWYGAPGTFKSLLLQDLAISTAHEKTWLEPKPGDTIEPMVINKNYPILWIDQDSGKPTVELRFKALARGHGITPQRGMINWFACPVPPVTLWPGNNSRTVNDFRFSQTTIITMALGLGVGMIVVDNLGSVSAGADENTRDMLEVLTALRYISEQTGASLHAIHHGNKKGDKSQYGARGHTSILQAVDFAFEVSRDSATDDVATVTCTKTRHQPIEAFSVLWTYEHGISGNLKKARFFGLGEVDDSKHKSTTRLAIDAIHEHFSDGMKQADIIALCKQHANVGRPSAIAAITKLEKSGELDTVQQAPRQPIFYSKTAKWRGK